MKADLVRETFTDAIVSSRDEKIHTTGVSQSSLILHHNFYFYRMLWKHFECVFRLHNDWRWPAGGCQYSVRPRHNPPTPEGKAWLACERSPKPGTSSWVHGTSAPSLTAPPRAQLIMQGMHTCTKISHVVRFAFWDLPFLFNFVGTFVTLGYRITLLKVRPMFSHADGHCMLFGLRCSSLRILQLARSNVSIWTSTT